MNESSVNSFKVSTAKEKRVIMLNAFRTYAAIQDNNYKLAEMYIEFTYSELNIDQNVSLENFENVSLAKTALAEGNYGRAKDWVHDLILELIEVMDYDIYK